MERGRDAVRNGPRLSAPGCTAARRAGQGHRDTETADEVPGLPRAGAAAGTWRTQTAARARHFFLPRSNLAAWGQKGNASNRGKRSVFAVRLSTLAGPLEKRGACGRGCVDIGAILLEPVAECRATTLCDAVPPFPPQQAFAASHERSLKSTRFPAVAGRPSSGGARVAASEKRSHLPPLCASHVHTRRGAVPAVAGRELVRDDDAFRVQVALGLGREQRELPRAKKRTSLGVWGRWRGWVGGRAVEGAEGEKGEGGHPGRGSRSNKERRRRRYQPRRGPHHRAPSPTCGSGLRLSANSSLLIPSLSDLGLMAATFGRGLTSQSRIDTSSSGS